MEQVHWSYEVHGRNAFTHSKAGFIQLFCQFNHICFFKRPLIPKFGIITYMKKCFKSALFSAAIILISCISYAQAPGIIWQNTIGGNDADELFYFHQTADGGYILGGDSESDNSGDKSDDAEGSGWGYYDTDCGVSVFHNYNDIWLVKLNSAGDLQWQKTIGGDDIDYAFTMMQTTDGGYLIGGTSASDISGSKTQDAWESPFFTTTFDYWVIKTDSLGNIQWQSTLGGNSDDILTALHQTPDGGYILGGYSYSALSGNKTEPNIGLTGTCDFWIIKINPDGGIVWQKTLGGAGSDRLESINITDDGGFIAGGYSNSNVSGDKSENCFGGYWGDYWVMKLDSIGNIIWQNTIGGDQNDYLKCVIPDTDGGFILGGNSLSTISGDKTESCLGGFAAGDYWIVKINAAGAIVWQNDLGGTADDELNSIIQDVDGGYILGGSSKSNISADKNENSIGDYDYWIVKLSTTGEIMWQNTIGGNGSDRLFSINADADNNICVGGYSTSGISGDKTEPDWVEQSGCFDGNSEDYWVMQLGCVPIVWYADADMDGYGNADESELSCLAPPGYLSDSLDCNDSEGLIHPFAVELCNNLDDDCNGTADEGLIFLTYYPDFDNDFFGNSDIDSLACMEIAGYVLNDEDCNDANALVNPDADEICNNNDDNCNALIDDGLIFTTYFEDADADAYGNPSIDTTACAEVDGYIENATDCNDLDPAINPSETEICNNIDDDCNGITDDGLLFITYFADSDADAFGDAAFDSLWCEPVPGFVSDSTDCDDSNPFIFPGAPELEDGVDNNCNDLVDEGTLIQNYGVKICSVFPNPADQFISVSELSLPALVDIYNMLGEIVLQKSLTRASEQIDIGALPEGSYIIQVNEKNYCFIKAKK